MANLENTYCLYGNSFLVSTERSEEKPASRADLACGNIE